MSANKHVNALILSIYPELAEDFIHVIPPENREATELGNYRVRFDIAADDPIQETGFEERVQRANVIALVVRFLDVLSVDKIKNIYRHLPTTITVPMAIFLLRDKSEVDFKISCPSCGQKLWLRDTDVGKRGRCPSCKKPFMILSQVDQLKSQLILPDSVKCVNVVRNDADSFQCAMIELLENCAERIHPDTVDCQGEESKNSTMRIQLQDV